VNHCYSWKTIGIPAPQGSKRHVGMGRMIESCKALKPWRQTVITDAQKLGITQPILTPVSVSLVFCFPRPKSHFKKNGDLCSSSPSHKTSKPDIDKLARAILDSLTLAGVFKDDAQVYSLTAAKRYCIGNEDPGVMITLMNTDQVVGND